MKEKVKKKCLTLTVDKKVMGPYLDRYRYRVAYMENKLGATFQTMWLTKGWLPWMKPTQERVKPDNTTPLLDDLGWRPVPKHH